MTQPHLSVPEHDLLIAGGGFAACSALSWLARFARGAFRLAVLTGSRNRADGGRLAAGCGMAYDDQDSAHLLNAPHWTMGILDDDPGGFTGWLSMEFGTTALADFVSRRTYGCYLEAQWAESLIALKARGVTVDIVARDAVAISDISDRCVSVIDGSGATLTCAALLVCTGPELAVQASMAHPRLIAPVWPGGLRQLVGARGHIAVIGTGLSGIDASITALAQPAVTRVSMISRDGRLPLPHDVAAQQRRLKFHFRGKPLEVLQAVRTAAATAPWQAVMNVLRGQSNALWQEWTPAQRRSALRHLGGLWAAHRNRLPVDVLGQIGVAMANRRLDVLRGSASLTIEPDGTLGVRLEHTGAPIQPDWIVDARGFARLTGDCDSLIGRAVHHGHFSISSLGYGVVADSSHRASLQGLAPVHVIGAARLGHLIETTGVPEVRTQLRESLEALFT